MKKILVFIAAVTLSLSACADHEQYVDYSELPILAQTFVTKYFNLTDITYVEREREGLHNEYNVYLQNATKIEFDHQGNLQSIDCHKIAVPEGIVHELITQYVALHHPNSFITEYAIGHRHLQVELNNGLELIFDLEGHFLRMDD